MDITVHKGGIVKYHDPYIQKIKTNEGNLFLSVALTEPLLSSVDVVVIGTNHKVFDIDWIQKNSKLIVDLRNMVKESNEKVYKL